MCLFIPPPFLSPLLFFFSFLSACFFSAFSEKRGHVWLCGYRCGETAGRRAGGSSTGAVPHASCAHLQTGARDCLDRGDSDEAGAGMPRFPRSRGTGGPGGTARVRGQPAGAERLVHPSPQRPSPRADRLGTGAETRTASLPPWRASR